MPRSSWTPTEEDKALVGELAACGVPQETIANRLGVAPKTLRLHCREALDQGMAEAGAAVAKRLFDVAMHGANDKEKANVTALIWLDKTRNGMSEKTQHELSGPGGGPIEEIRRVIVQAKPQAEPNGGS